MQSVPFDLLPHTFEFLNSHDLAAIMQTCTRFNKAARHTQTGRLWSVWSNFEPQVPLLINELGPSRCTENLISACSLSPFDKFCSLIGKNICLLKIKTKLNELEQAAGRLYEAEDIIDCRLLTGKLSNQTQQLFCTVTQKLITTWRIQKEDIVPQNHVHVEEETEIFQSHMTNNVLVLQVKRSNAMGLLFKDLENYSKDIGDFIEPKVRQEDELTSASTVADELTTYQCEANDQFCVLYSTKLMTVLTLNEKTRVFQQLWTEYAKIGEEEQSNILQQYSQVHCNEKALIRKITPAGEYCTEFESIEPLTGKLRFRYKCSAQQKIVEDHFWLIDEILFWQERLGEISVGSIFGKRFSTKVFSHSLQMTGTDKGVIVVKKPENGDEIKVSQMIKKTVSTLRKLSMAPELLSEALHRGKEAMSSVVARVYAFSTHSPLFRSI